MQPTGREQKVWPVWVAAGVAALLLHLLQWELLPFVLAAIVGFVTDPVIRWTCRKTRLPRWAASSALYLLLALGVGGLTLAVGLSAYQDVSHLAGAGAGPLRTELQSVLGPGGVTLFGQRITADTLVGFLQEQAHRVLNAATLLDAGRPVLAGAIGVVLLVVLVFYMMVSGPTLARGALWLVPPGRRSALEAVLPAMTRVVQRYFIGVVVVVAFTAFAAWVGYGLVLHVHHAFVLAAALGVLETVPAVGPVLSAGLVAMAALQLHSLAATAGMIAYALALRLLIDDLIAPVVLGRSVAAHPVAVMLAYVLGAVLFGVSGLLLSVPAAACLRIALKAAYGEPPAAVGAERLKPREAAGS